MQVEVTCTQTSKKWHALGTGQSASSPAKAAKITYKVHNLADKPASHRREQHASEVEDTPGELDRLVNLLKNHQVMILAAIFIHFMVYVIALQT